MTAGHPRAETLRSIPLFARLADDALARVSEAASEFEVPAGHVLVQPGQEGTGLFILESGSAEVEVGSRRIPCGPGEVIGELSLLAEGVRHVARVRASEPLRGLAINRHDFLELLHTEPEMTVAMVEVLAHRLVEADELLSRS